MSVNASLTIAAGPQPGGRRGPSRATVVARRSTVGTPARRRRRAAFNGSDPVRPRRFGRAQAGPVRA
eukprot:119069-Hanusia_phi.AAC.6